MNLPLRKRLMFDAQSTFSFAVQQATSIEATVYRVKYPSYDYAAIIPVVTQGNEWARSTTFFSADIAGKAEWLSGAANDIPYAEIDRSMFEHPFHMAGIGYQWNLEELQVAQMMGLPLTSDKATAARRIAEKFLYDLATVGNTSKGWTGLINNAGVTAGDVPADGTGSVTWWAQKTPDQILRDINAALSGVYTGTSETELADTILLPTESYLDIALRRLDATSETTILDFVRTKNVYTAETGQPLLIRALRALKTADPGGDGRMVTYRRDPEVVRFHLPMPHRFLPVWQNGPMNWMIPGILRTGGVEVRLPKAIRYSDGIYDA